MSIRADKSISHWLTGLKSGDAEAQAAVFARVFGELREFVARRLRGADQRVRDAEDVAVDAMNSLFRGLQEDRFRQISDRNDLWQVAFMLAGRKATDLVRHVNRLKRGGGQLRGESVFLSAGGSGTGIDGQAAEGQSAEDIAEYAESLLELFRELDDSALVEVCRMRMAGFTNREIADQLGCVERTVERKIDVIQQVWVAERFRQEWTTGQSPRLEQFIGMVNGVRLKRRLLRSLLRIESDFRGDEIECVRVDEYCESLPSLAVEIRGFFADRSGV